VHSPDYQFGLRYLYS